MDIRRPVRFGIRGIPLLPFILMGTALAAATVVASQTETNTFTISASYNLALLTWNGSACTTTSFTAIAYGSVNEGSSFSHTDHFCIKNTSTSQTVYIGMGSSTYQITSGSIPSGATYTISDDSALSQDLDLNRCVWGATAGSTTWTLAVANAGCVGIVGTTITSDFVIQFTVPGTAPPGSYSWTVTVNAYSTNAG